MHLSLTLIYLYRLSCIDLKVENILFDLRRAVLADFGIAVRETEAAAKGAGGTLGYLSPEVYLHGYQTKESDVYALGVVLWALVTGSRPHYGFHDTRALLAYMAMGFWFAWPNEVHAYGGNLVALVERCCHVDPSQRPSARHVADDLLQIAELLRAQCSEDELEAAWGG
ncbi:Putative protein kinase superfamily protein [Klebsormidium nitens]|uniref:Protein kinase domain-containing protein n=1 Tax=Klebsormidium nitens TaxID=105231 RepID=A0A1Y1I257_KLENI|nr:Putative protein kinase superfamily protein [Klebsormidium nitens]|eukprot:GAQ83519.1 Putative protein kinase superfamily protein [Klebsormidium nitens]